MKLEKNNNVKIYLRNNLVISGIVESWSARECKLISTDGSNCIILPNPLSDIVAVFILTEPSVKEKIVIREETISELEKKFEETYNEPSSDDLRIKKLSELKILLAQQEKKIVAEKLKDHTLPMPKETKYGYPRLPKK
jgi:hypothetical protein